MFGKTIAALVMVIIVLGGLGLIALYSGTYNIAASEPHTPFGRWLFNTAMVNSVERRADRVPAPPSQSRSELREAARHYHQACEHCHGAPGVAPHKWATAMRPDPPDLSKAADEWTENEIFWIAKHGIKMTGMPAFGEVQSDEVLRAIAAFVTRLPSMAPQEYAEVAGLEAGSGNGHAGPHHDSGGGHTGHGSESNDKGAHSPQQHE